MIANAKIISVKNEASSAGVALCAEAEKAEMAGKSLLAVSSCRGGVGPTWATLNLTHTLTHTLSFSFCPIKAFLSEYPYSSKQIKKCHSVLDLLRMFSTQCSQQTCPTYAGGTTLTYFPYYHTLSPSYLLILIFFTII